MYATNAIVIATSLVVTGTFRVKQISCLLLAGFCLVRGCVGILDNVFVVVRLIEAVEHGLLRALSGSSTNCCSRKEAPQFLRERQLRDWSDSGIWRNW